MPLNEWRNHAPDLPVKALTEHETPITAHFSKPEVQNIGSTSDCGCDFPHVMFQNGDWPWSCPPMFPFIISARCPKWPSVMIANRTQDVCKREILPGVLVAERDAVMPLLVPEQHTLRRRLMRLTVRTHVVKEHLLMVFGGDVTWVRAEPKPCLDVGVGRAVSSEDVADPVQRQVCAFVDTYCGHRLALVLKKVLFVAEMPKPEVGAEGQT
jgi:hypothetical protein